MFISNKRFLSGNNKLIIILWDLLLFSYIICEEAFKSLSCKFPKCQKMYNGNYLLCCDTGIYIYDQNFETELDKHEFNTIIGSKADAEFFTITQFTIEDGGNIIVLTKDNYYLLTSEGHLIFEDSISLDNKGTYYMLKPYKINNNYNFIVGIINTNSSLNLKYYNIDSSGKKINLISNYVPDAKNSLGNIANNLFNGFSCEIMDSNSYKNVLTCFYGIGYPEQLGIISFKIQETSIEIIDELSNIFNSEKRPNFIKSVLSPDKSKAMICFSDYSSKGYFLYYDINNHELSSVTEYISICLTYASSIQIQYFSETQEYMFSCSSNSKFKVVKFDKDMNIIENEKLKIKENYDKIKMLNEQINELNNINNKYYKYDKTAIELIKEKENEIKEIKAKLPFELNKGDQIISLIFITHDEVIYHPIISKISEQFIMLESQFYTAYPEYKNFEHNFFVNGKKIERFNTLKENGIKNNDIITIIRYKKIFLKITIKL